VILLPLSMKRELRLQAHRKNSARNTKNFFNGMTKILQQPVLHVPDRQQMQ
jgi:hypothetical protein